MPYTYKEILPYFKGSETTLRRKVKGLKAKKLFKKEYQGKCFSEIEVIKISELLGFSISLEEIKKNSA